MPRRNRRRSTGMRGSRGRRSAYDGVYRRHRCDDCGKIAWRTEERALEAAEAAGALRAYACPAGSGWHITRQPQRAKPRRFPTQE